MTIRVLACAVALAVAAATSVPVRAARGAPSIPIDAEAARALTAQSTLDLPVVRLALSAAACAQRLVAVAKPSLLTIIDYSRPSTVPRLWVLDLAGRRVLYEELVAHGQGTGANLATRFSNQPDSRQSSLGLFLTAGTYVGRNGYSMRLVGLEPDVNDRAVERAIVMHGASYVSAAAARATGRLGRSWGCPAVRTAVARPLIETIRDGSLVFAYYPDARWLGASAFLGGCAAGAAPTGVPSPVAAAPSRLGPPSR